MKTGSLRFRLFVATALSVSIALMLAFWGLGLLFASHVERRAIDDLSVQLDQILAGVERDEKGKIRIGSAPADARFSKPLGASTGRSKLRGFSYAQDRYGISLSIFLRII